MRNALQGFAAISRGILLTAREILRYPMRVNGTTASMLNFDGN